MKLKFTNNKKLVVIVVVIALMVKLNRLVFKVILGRVKQALIFIFKKQMKQQMQSMKSQKQVRQNLNLFIDNCEYVSRYQIYKIELI